jgi:hypothetical protein
LTYLNVEPTYYNVHHYFHSEPFVRYMLAKKESSNSNNRPEVGRRRASVDLAGRRFWLVL